MPRISVVIPLYNKEKLIRRALNSVLSQSCDDFEVVVVDDGSTDNSAEVVKCYSDPRIRLIRQVNAGVSAARNRGIAEVRADWVAFLDADDEYLPDFLESVGSCVEKFPEAGAIYADPMWMSGGVVLNKSAHSKVPELLKDYFEYVVYREGNEIHSSCIAVKKEIFSRAGLFPVGVRVGEDSDMWMRVAWTTRIAHIPEFLSIYHMDAGDSNWEDERHKEAYWIITYRQWLSERRIPRNLLKSSEAYYQRYLLGKAALRALHGEKLAAFRCLLKDVRWKAAPKKYAFKVLLNAFLSTARIRSKVN